MFDVEGRGTDCSDNRDRWQGGSERHDNSTLSRPDCSSVYKVWRAEANSGAMRIICIVRPTLVSPPRTRQDRLGATIRGCKATGESTTAWGDRKGQATCRTMHWSVRRSRLALSRADGGTRNSSSPWWRPQARLFLSLRKGCLSTSATGSARPTPRAKSCAEPGAARGARSPVRRVGRCRGGNRGSDQ